MSEFEKVVEIMARANARECSEEGDWEGYEDGIAAAIRAIRSKGWAIVSRKATKEMADIGADVLAKEHANFFVNKGGGRARDVRELVRRVQKRVQERYGIFLEEEIQYVGFPEN